jgi:signal peptidase
MQNKQLGIIALIAAMGSWPAHCEELFKSEQLTPSGEYTSGIEGPATDTRGSLYVANYQTQGTVGEILPGESNSHRFAVLPRGSIGNGIRFDVRGRMYVADYKRHNVFVFDAGRSLPKVYFHSSRFNQPNDLAMAGDGTLYASDPNFRSHAGRIWKIARSRDGRVSGRPMLSDRVMGESNGLDLSPDETTLYVSESDTRRIWAYRIHGNRLTSSRLVIEFEQGELDGLRTDLAGRIYVARPKNGTIALIGPDGTLVREITLRGKDPTNLTFGGVYGKTIFVTQRDGRFIERFEVDVRGREPCMDKKRGW